MKDLALLAVDTARQQGASYADVRLIETAREALSVRNGAIGEVAQTEDAGFGVRVLAQGAWGFACSPRLTKDEVERVAARAVEVAKASATVKNADVRLAPEPARRDAWYTPCTLNPFQVSQEEKLALLFNPTSLRANN